MELNPDSGTSNAQEGKLGSERLLSLFLDHLKTEHNWTDKDIESFVKDSAEKPEEKSSEVLGIPVSIFAERRISSFEAIVKYLHEDYCLNFSDIAKLTNRDPRSIWNSYHSAVKKLPKRFAKTLLSEEYLLPLDMVSSRRLSVLESIVDYLNSNHNLAYNKIAKLLNRDLRTIYTIRSRISKKKTTGGAAKDE